jgi:hypothetical protein
MWSQAIVTQQYLPKMTEGSSCTNVTRGPVVAQQWEPMDPIVALQWIPTMGPPVPLLRKTRQKNMEGPTRCCSLTVEREEHLTIHRLVTKQSKLVSSFVVERLTGEWYFWNRYYIYILQPRACSSFELVRSRVVYICLLYNNCYKLYDINSDNSHWALCSAFVYAETAINPDVTDFNCTCRNSITTVILVLRKRKDPFFGLYP